MFFLGFLSVLYTQPMLAAVGIVFIPSDNTTARVSFFVLYLGVSLQLMTVAVTLTLSRTFNSTFAALNCMLILRGLDILLIRRVFVSEDGNLTGRRMKRTPLLQNGISKTGIRADISAFSRYWKGFTEIPNFLETGTPWEIKTNPFSDIDPNYVPSKPVFIMRTLLRVIISYIILDTFTLLPADPEAMSESKQYVFSRHEDVTVAEIGEKVAGALIMACMIIGTVSFWLGGWAIISVGLGISHPKDWPPFWGKVREAWSIRQLWGTCWHQLMRTFIENISDVVSTDILHIQKGTLLSRYIRLYICFFLSGIIHVAGSLTNGVSFRDDGSVRFFTMSAFGIMFEDAVQALYYKAGGKPSRFAKTIGVVWTLLFFAWVIPVYTWPVGRAMTRADTVVPYSVVKLMMGKEQSWAPVLG